MKKWITVLTLLALICSLPISGFVKTSASAAEERASNPQTSTVTYEQASDTVYATTDVNVRTGPGTKYAIIDVLSQGKSVVRTGIGSNGWSKVMFGGSEGYIRSKYLSGTKQAESQKKEASRGLTSFDGTSVAFESVNQIVYTTNDVNLRVGPGTEYESLGQCALGESIQRTGIGENGWSRVIYKGETAYVRSKYLFNPQPGVQALGAGIRGDMHGRLTIPSVGVDVGLYYCSSDSKNASLLQSIVDADDSAAFIDQTCITGVIIADHNNQGFSAIRSCVPNETRAYIDYGTHTQEYICTAVGLGKNTGSDLRDWNNNSLNYGSIPGGLAMYTCNEDWNNITITYWQVI